MERANLGSLFTFLRDKDLIVRREKINRIERHVRDVPIHYHFSVREVTEIINRAGFTVHIKTVRWWISIGLLRAYRRGRNGRPRVWVMKSHILKLCEQMTEMSKALEEYREAVKREPRYITQDRVLPDRNSLGQFVKKKDERIDHDIMYGKLG